jgi:hypothetical protein
LQIVGEANISGVRQRDISELVLKLSYWFGNLGVGEHSPLHIFDSFNGLKGLLFKVIYTDISVIICKYRITDNSLPFLLFTGRDIGAVTEWESLQVGTILR